MFDFLDTKAVAEPTVVDMSDVEEIEEGRAANAASIFCNSSSVCSGFSKTAIISFLGFSQKKSSVNAYGTNYQQKTELLSELHQYAEGTYTIFPTPEAEPFFTEPSGHQMTMFDFLDTKAVAEPTEVDMSDVEEIEEEEVTAEESILESQEQETTKDSEGQEPTEPVTSSSSISSTSDISTTVGSATAFVSKKSNMVISLPLDFEAYGTNYQQKTELLSELHQYAEGTYTIFPTPRRS